MAYGNNTEEEASEEESEEDLPEAEVWVGDDLGSGEYGEVEVLEDGTRVADEWVGVDFEGGTPDLNSDPVAPFDRHTGIVNSPDQHQTTSVPSRTIQVPDRNSQYPDPDRISPVLKPDKSGAEIIDFTAFSAQFSHLTELEYNSKKWKRSRVKPGYLVKRIPGYIIVESEYGVQYLKVLQWNPTRTSADLDLYPVAQFCNWEALTDAGRLVKEKTSERKQRRR